MSNKTGKRRRKPESEEETEMPAANNGDEVDLDVSLARENNAVSENVDAEEGALRYKDIYIPPPPPSTCTFDNTGPRLIVHTIVVDNFKSFYGKHIIGPFFKGMSAVVGPNGSGKSNVLDSILFVLGYRASKIRTKKVSMLIHNSSGHTDLQSCTVTVNFCKIIDKGRDVDPEIVPNTELVVSRTALRDSSSYYTLDGKRAQFKDVAAKLQSHGIDLTNGRFLILQGEVEQIALMKPKGENENDIGLLEFLEDIIGTLRYRVPLAKAVEIDNILEEARETQAEKVATAEKALKTLSEGKQEAIQYLQTDNAIMRVQYKILQKQKYESEKKMKVHEEEKSKIEEKLTDIKKEIDEAHGKTKEVEKTIKDKTDEMEKMYKENEKRDANYKVIKNKDTQMRENMTSRGARRKKLRDNLKSEEKKLEDLRGLPEKNTKEIAELEKLLARHERDLATTQESLVKATEGLSRDIKEPQEKMRVLQEKLQGVAKDRDEKESIQRIILSKLDLCTKGEKVQKEKLETLVKNLHDAKENLEQKNGKMSELNKELPKLQQELTETSEALEIERGERGRVDQRAAKLRADINNLRMASEANTKRNRVVSSLMDQCKNGSIPGVFGRLGDLGGIDAKYDCAISSSCGALNHIVVDKVDTAEKCINYLKQTGIGRGNFMVLEKLQVWGPKSREKFVSPENVPRLFDLVKVEDERVLPAFYFALRDTLVAKDIEQASRIGLGRVRYRVVDLNGNIVEPGGTITGGGTPLRGLMGQAVTVGLAAQKAREETPKLTQNLEQLEQRSTVLMQNVIKLEQKERELRGKLPGMQTEARKVNMDLSHLKDSIPALEKQVKEQKEVVKNTSSDEAKVKKLQADVQKSTEDLKKANAAVEKYESEINKLQKQIEEIKNTHIGGLDNKVKELTKKINKAQADKTKLSAQIASVERNIQKSEEKMTDLEQEIKTMEEEIVQIKSEWEVIAAKASALLAVKEECSNEILQRNEEITEMREGVKKMVAAELELKKKRHEVEVEIDKVNNNVLKYKGRANDLKKQLKSMKLEDIPGEEKMDPLPELGNDELEVIEMKDLDYALSMLNGNRAPRPNMAIIEEYRVKESQFVEMAVTLEEATQRRNEVKNFVNNARKQRYKEFMSGFQLINQKLREVFRMISMGGDAELELQDTFNPFLEGIAFSVRPCSKSWTPMDKLSGGEKTLSSLALVFGLHYYKPSPFYMMDEIDAALDARNVSIIGCYIREFTVNCQFIVISLRPEMYDLFKRRIVGIFKPDGCSRTSCVDPGDLTFPCSEESETTQENFDSFQDSSLNNTLDSTMETVTVPPQPATGAANTKESAKTPHNARVAAGSNEEVDDETENNQQDKVAEAEAVEPEATALGKRKSGQAVSPSEGSISPPAKRKGKVVESSAPSSIGKRGGNKNTESPASSTPDDEISEKSAPVKPRGRGRRGSKKNTESPASSTPSDEISEKSAPVKPRGRGRRGSKKNTESSPSSTPDEMSEKSTPVQPQGRGRKGGNKNTESSPSSTPSDEFSEKSTPAQPRGRGRRGGKKASESVATIIPPSDEDSSPLRPLGGAKPMASDNEVPETDEEESPVMPRAKRARAGRQQDSDIESSFNESLEIPPSDEDESD